MFCLVRHYRKQTADANPAQPAAAGDADQIEMEHAYETRDDPVYDEPYAVSAPGKW